MKSYIKVIVLLITLFIAMFIAVEALNIGVLRDPTPVMKEGRVVTALIGISLLAADVFIPVPASLIMLINGALFGVFIGTALSIIGGLAAFLVAFMVGRKGGPWLLRTATPEEREKANRFIHNWGLLAIVITRPFPILSETVAVIAGTTSMSISKGILAAIMGYLPVALLYALIGAIATTFKNLVIAFIFVIIVAGLIWFILLRLEKKTSPSENS